MRAADGFGETEGQIVDAYHDLMAEKPYGRITVKEITEKCDIARTTFYRSFEDTDDLLDQIERYLLDQLHLYRPHTRSYEDDALAGRPFESIECWCESCMEMREMLNPIMGRNGDVYFKERLQAQMRSELNQMMDDDRAPKDERRSYYVAMLAAAHIGLLEHVAKMQSDLIDAKEMAIIANSGRAAYFKAVEGAPHISDERLFGEHSPDV